MKKQTDIILEHLTNRGSITSMDALKLYGIARLASRVSELKKAGVPVVRKMETVRNRFGVPVSIARYSLAGGGDDGGTPDVCADAD